MRLVQVQGGQVDRMRRKLLKSSQRGRTCVSNASGESEMRPLASLAMHAGLWSNISYGGLKGEIEWL